MSELITRLYELYQALPALDRQRSRWVMPPEVIDTLIGDENERRQRERERLAVTATHIRGFTWEPSWYEPIPHPGYEAPGTVLGRPIRVEEGAELRLEVLADLGPWEWVPMLDPAQRRNAPAGEQGSGGG
jgi:hypothetical protein